MNGVKDSLNFTMDYTNPGDYESAAEHNNRVIQEWYRTAMHQVPYKVFPQVLIEGLMKETIKHINMFPLQHGISSGIDVLLSLQGGCLYFPENYCYYGERSTRLDGFGTFACVRGKSSLLPWQP